MCFRKRSRTIWRALEKKGVLRRAKDRARGLMVAARQSVENKVSLPILGRVPAGLPLEAISEVEDYLAVDEAHGQTGQLCSPGERRQHVSPHSGRRHGACAKTRPWPTTATLSWPPWTMTKPRSSGSATAAPRNVFGTDQSRLSHPSRPHRRHRQSHQPDPNLFLTGEFRLIVGPVS
jgi:hypothetical protein